MTPHVTVSASLISSPWLLTVPFINGSLLWARPAYFRALLCIQITFSIGCNSKWGSQDKDMIHQRTLRCCSGTHSLFFKPTRQATGTPRDRLLITHLAKSRFNWWRCVDCKIRSVTHMHMITPGHIVCRNKTIIKQSHMEYAHECGTKTNIVPKGNTEGRAIFNKLFRECVWVSLQMVSVVRVEAGHERRDGPDSRAAVMI